MPTYIKLALPFNFLGCIRFIDIGNVIKHVQGKSRVSWQKKINSERKIGYGK